MEGKVNSGYGGSLPEALGATFHKQCELPVRAIHPFHYYS